MRVDLDRHEPNRRSPEFGWAWLDRLAHRLTARQYRLLVNRHVQRPCWRPAKVCLLLIAVLMLVPVAGLLVLGGYLIVHDFPNGTLVPGTILILILMALVLRIRLGRLRIPGRAGGEAAGSGRAEHCAGGRRRRLGGSRRRQPYI